MEEVGEGEGGAEEGPGQGGGHQVAPGQGQHPVEGGQAEGAEKAHVDLVPETPELPEREGQCVGVEGKSLHRKCKQHERAFPIIQTSFTLLYFSLFVKLILKELL